MSDLVFRISPNVILGTHTAQRLGQLVSEWGTRFVLFADPVLKEYSVAEKIQSYLQERQIDCFLYDDIPAAPDSSVLEQALKLVKSAHIHGVIAVGGTKAVNTGRAVAALYNESNSIYDFIEGAQPCSAALPFIAIPTTMRDPFLFSERSPVIDARNRQLRLLKTQKNLSRLVLFDTNLSSTLTENQRMSLSFQIMCIAMEAYVSSRSNFFSDTVAEKAVDLVLQSLDGTSVASITAGAEMLLAQAGCMASLASGLSALGLASACALVLNAREKFSRSLVTAILFPHFIEDVQYVKMDKIAFMASKINPASASSEAPDRAASLASHLRVRLAQSGLPTRLKDLSLDMSKLAIIAQDAVQLEFMQYNPRSMNTDDLFNLLKKAY